MQRRMGGDKPHPYKKQGIAVGTERRGHPYKKTGIASAAPRNDSPSLTKKTKTERGFEITGQFPV